MAAGLVTEPLHRARDDFFAGLADIGYKGRLSLEDNGGDGDAMNPQGLARMRELAAKYGL